MTTRAKTFAFQTSVKWTADVRGILSTSGRPDIVVSTPPELRGPDGNWGPEHLYVASIETCLMFTFLALARGRQLVVRGYESQSEGMLEPVEGLHVVSQVTVRPKIAVGSPEDVETAKALAAIMHDRCFISNSVESVVVVEPDVYLVPGA